MRTHTDFELCTVTSFATYNALSEDNDLDIAKSYDHFLPLTYSNTLQHSTMMISFLLRSIIPLDFGVLYCTESFPDPSFLVFSNFFFFLVVI